MDLNEQTNAPNAQQLALWGGLECTVNRVRDNYFSQMDRNGHAGRLQDIERFASLGIKAIRYPVLWERTAPDGIDKADWTWPDERLPALRDLGVTPRSRRAGRRSSGQVQSALSMPSGAVRSHRTG